MKAGARGLVAGSGANNSINFGVSLMFLSAGRAATIERGCLAGWLTTKPADGLAIARQARIRI